MNVYLIAAPEDEAEGDKLAAYLKRFGVMVRTEFGRFGFPPARPREFTVALWSRKAMVSSRQMLLTNRAIDAWAEGRLIMARLEHGLNPRGLSDLQMIDLTMEAAREHRYREVLDGLRALEADQRKQDAPQSLSLELPGDGPVTLSTSDIAETFKRARAAENNASDPGLTAGGEGVVASRMAGRRQPTVAANRMASRPEPQMAPPKASSGGLSGLLVSGVLLVIIALLGWAVWDGRLSWSQAVLIGGGVLVAFMFIGLLVSLLSGDTPPASKRSSSPPRAPVARPAAPAPKLAERSLSTPIPAIAASAASSHEVFVSYAHDNATTVLPIVTQVEKGGVSIWIDREEMRAGQNWAAQIVRAIKAANRFCIMCSEQAFASDHVRREVYLADKYGKDMVPIRLDGAEMPEDIEYFLIDRQWVDLTSLEDDEQASAVREALKNEES
nr:toll/interleukin-1 receptor domain-containing protein [Hyphomonas sp. Mor2]